MRSYPLLIIAAVLLFAACGGEDIPAPPTTPDDSAQAQGDFMKSAEGTWEGTNTLWMQYPENPQESAAKVVVSPGRIEYSWAYQDEPQTGTFEFSGSGYLSRRLANLIAEKELPKIFPKRSWLD